MAGASWMYFLGQQYSLAYVLVFMLALYIQGHFQSRRVSKNQKVAGGVVVTGLLVASATCASIATSANSHDSFKWAYAMYLATSTIFDCFVIGRLNDLWYLPIRLEDDEERPQGGLLRRTFNACRKTIKTCPPSFIFQLIQGTVVVGLSFKGLEDLGRYLRPQLIGNHAQAARRLDWFSSALHHFQVATLVEAALMTCFTITVYVVVMRMTTKEGDMPENANRSAWCALLIATMLMSMRATSNAVVMMFNSTVSGDPLVDTRSVLFWAFDMLPALCSFCLIFLMDDGNVDTHPRKGRFATTRQSDFAPASYADEKVLIISVPGTA